MSSNVSNNNNYNKKVSVFLEKQKTQETGPPPVPLITLYFVKR